MDASTEFDVIIARYGNRRWVLRMLIAKLEDLNQRCDKLEQELERREALARQSVQVSQCAEVKSTTAA